MQIIMSLPLREGHSTCPSVSGFFTSSSNRRNIVTAPPCHVVFPQQSTDANRQCKTTVSLHNSNLWDLVLSAQADSENKTPQHSKIRTVP